MVVGLLMARRSTRFPSAPRAAPGADYVIGVAALDRPSTRGTASADQLIRPTFRVLSAWNFAPRGRGFVQLGEAAAERAMPAIRADLERRRNAASGA